MENDERTGALSSEKEVRVGSTIFLIRVGPDPKQRGVCEAPMNRAPIRGTRFYIIHLIKMHLFSFSQKLRKCN